MDTIIEGMPAACRDPARRMLATGLRPGDWRALTGGDAHLDAKQPVERVTKATKAVPEAGDDLGDPKSKCSVRSVGLSPSTVEMLWPYVKGRRPSERLFDARRRHEPVRALDSE